MDEQTLRRFVAPDGRILTIPAKHAKRVEFLDWLAQDFEPGVTFPEAEVNSILLRRHDDYPALRRYLVDQGFLTRQGNVYWRTGGTVPPEPEQRDDPTPGLLPEPMYEPFAEAFERHAAASAYNAHYDRPAVLDLVGPVDGFRVLDAGCGPGLYAEELTRRGAQVSAFDSSPSMVDLARRRLGAGADVRVGDLERPFDWLRDDDFDLALLALVLHHVEARVGMLREIRRVLRPGGHLVVSTTHPTSDWLLKGGSYFDSVEIEEVWQQDWPVRYWRQPLQAWCDEFAQAGFLIERVVEPQPSESMMSTHPEVFAQLKESPGFIAFRLVSPS